MGTLSSTESKHITSNHLKILAYKSVGIHFVKSAFLLKFFSELQGKINGKKFLTDFFYYIFKNVPNKIKHWHEMGGCPLTNE